MIVQDMLLRNAVSPFSPTEVIRSPSLAKVYILLVDWMEKGEYKWFDLTLNGWQGGRDKKSGPWEDYIYKKLWAWK
jgi:hypothetical protein